MRIIKPAIFMSNNFRHRVSGVDGDLVITNGQTVTVAAGSVKHYNSINIQTGGTLSIIGTGGITEIGCRNSCNIMGSIIFQEDWAAGNSSKTSVFSNLNMPFNLTQSNGGNGGQGGNSNGGGARPPGGAQSLGRGGGGAGGGTYVSGNQTGNAIWDATKGNGGNGAHFNSIGYNGPGGLGGGGSGGYGSYGGAGGGGGYRGKHGGRLHLFVEGKTFTGTGTIDLRGQTGFNGGSAGGGEGGGGGGGGGAGGSGGRLYISYRSTSVPSLNILLTGGSGGSGGGGAVGAWSDGYNGGSGTAGVVGTSTTIQIPSHGYQF